MRGRGDELSGGGELRGEWAFHLLRREGGRPRPSSPKPRILGDRLSPLGILIKSYADRLFMSKYSWVLALFLVFAAAFACGCVGEDEAEEAAGAAEEAAHGAEGAAAEAAGAVDEAAHGAEGAAAEAAGAVDEAAEEAGSAADEAAGEVEATVEEASGALEEAASGH